MKLRSTSTPHAAVHNISLYSVNMFFVRGMVKVVHVGVIVYPRIISAFLLQLPVMVLKLTEIGQRVEHESFPASFSF